MVNQLSSEIVHIAYLISESLPAQARNVSNWLLGWDIHALKKLNSPRLAARAFASLYTGSYLCVHHIEVASSYMDIAHRL